ncbi:hypothetical protein C5748_18425 [Phyllobacterium phragmitis]|uniref:Uncharacterized protein n=1 Tax=Phyllobacterium phragmitis TaxID=2670329 RepID=A0A2S9INM9_9HYPH|nr:hypothetical protein C5748_18425 [Phyllobacterium phragmitis]
MGTALRQTIETMALDHGNAPGPWLDDLERKLITEAKGTITQGISIDAEAESLGIGIRVLQGIIGATRSGLARKE